MKEVMSQPRRLEFSLPTPENNQHYSILGLISEIYDVIKDLKAAGMGRLLHSHLTHIFSLSRKLLNLRE